MKRLLLPLVTLGFSLLGFAAETWTPLFNGKDFTGWETYLAAPAAPAGPGARPPQPIGVNKDPHGAFSVVQVDGTPAIRIAGDIPGGIATLSSYSNYHLRLQFRWGARRTDAKPSQLANSGLLFHGHGRHGEGNGRWLPSHQFQIQPGNCGDYIAMGDSAALIPAQAVEAKKRVFAPGAEPILFSNTPPDVPRCGKAGGMERPSGEWNTIELYCYGDRFLQVVNGVPVLEGRSRMRAPSGSAEPLDAGRLELQAEGWEIFFRDVEIAPLTAWPEELAAGAGKK
ncbi:DUF1080 domain-containing protein [Opitutaceae bacterium EW11]|nr:DUF1080 domain-containing protein [Opitutaceae bacterium EW11]